MPKSTRNTRNTGKPWTASDMKQLKQLAKQHTPSRVIGLKMGRTASAVQQKASQEGISLRPANRSASSRRKGK